MRHVQVLIRLFLIALFLHSGLAATLAKDPVKEAQDWAKEAQAQRDNAKETAKKLDCEKPKGTDMQALAKAIKEARKAAENAQAWADEAKSTAEKAANWADQRPNDKRAQEAKDKAQEAADAAQKAATEARTAYEEALDQSEGMKAAVKLEKQLDQADTDGNSKKGQIVDRLKKTANTAAEKNHCNPEEVKRAVRVELEKIKKEVARNGEMKPWTDALEQTLKDNQLIYHQGTASGEELVYTPRGTGQTTGHIADLVVFNPTGQPVYLALLPMFIPSDGKYQYYVTLATGPYLVPPHGTFTILLYGNCANIFALAVPAGVNMPPVSTWITVDDPVAADTYPPEVVFPPTRTVPGLDTDWQPSAADGWVPVAGEGNNVVTVTYPGTDIPLGYTIDPVRHPEAAAPVLLDMLKRITQAFEEQKAAGTISTPFSGNPEKERETNIQHSFWIASAALTGNSYKLEQFRENTVNEFARSTGRDYASLAQPEKDQIDGGIQAFWVSFEGVGIAAKVIQKNDI
ncbi:MAG: hypothetical protein EP344_03030 [Bacteroidetes bacterium]|nr:MAG: hypothetical protein EP344_03030 [Bacteroidota bacterium]